MKKLWKGILILSLITAVVSLTGCNDKTNENNNTNTSNPPVTENPNEEQNIELIAPSVAVSENLVLQITPSTDSGTVEKTTGYEVTINGETQTLGKDQLSLELPLCAGNDEISVRAIGGEKTESKNESVITVTEAQKEAIAYKNTVENLENRINEKLSTISGFDSQASVDEILAIYQDGNNLVCTVKYSEINTPDFKYQNDIVFENISENGNENIFDINNVVNKDNFFSSIKDFSPKILKPHKTFDNLINGSYINGVNKTSSISELGGLINDGWTSSVVHENMGLVTTSSGNYFGNGVINKFTTSSLVKLEKQGEENKYLQVDYRVYVNSTYSTDEVLEKIADGTMPAEDIIIESETVVDRGASCGIYLDAKEKYEGKEIEMNQGATNELMSFETSNGDSYRITMDNCFGY
ncbi:MAG: hypothetical protein WCR30_03230 [Clostridia bacterium]